jgi:hypothetical protein
VAAVTSTSTRAPIYKAFACRENIGDVTAKGECISNIADLVLVVANLFLYMCLGVPLFAVIARGICSYLL